MGLKAGAVVGGVACLAVAGMIVWVSLDRGAEGDGTPAPGGTTWVQDATTDAAIVPVDRDGQAAGGGDFTPLSVPEGVDSGVGASIPDDQLTQPDGDIGPGDVVIANPYQSDVAADPYVLLSVDTFSPPLSGKKRSTAYAASGMALDPSRVVQEVTLRVRQIAGSGDAKNWNLAASVMPVNLKLETMTSIPRAGDDCGDARTPLAGHGTATSDTVKVCLYVFGPVNTPGSPISSVMVQSRVDGKTRPLYIQSDVVTDTGIERSHELEHNAQWWKTDPETGLPLIDPDTGKPVPKDPTAKR